MRGTRLSFAAPGLSAHTEGIRMKRGVRQGACTSPAVWVLVLDYALRPCAERWTNLGWGFKLAPVR
eukprot:6838516-Alexandrium_andersonii.AAC.1